jgi:hypothetical protein
MIIVLGSVTALEEHITEMVTEALSMSFYNVEKTRA